MEKVKYWRSREVRGNVLRREGDETNTFLGVSSMGMTVSQYQGGWEL
jgi:hypothetical protein